MSKEFKLRARLPSERDDTKRVSDLFVQASQWASNNASNPRPVCILSPERLSVAAFLPMSEAVTYIRGEGAIFVGNGGDGPKWDKFWLGKISNIRFEGPWGTCLTVPTANVDGAHQVFEDVEFGNGCKVGIDQVSFENSRSTNTHITDCKSRSAEFCRIFSDVCSIQDCNIRYIGGNQVLTIDSNATIKGTIFTPNTFSTSASAWIKLLSSEQGRGIYIDHGCRFGGEGNGGMPVVESWARGNDSFGSDYGYQTKIDIRCAMASPCSPNIGRRSIVVLHAMPNLVKLQGIGASTAYDGLVSDADDLLLIDQKYASIEIDDYTRRTQLLLNPQKLVSNTIKPYLRGTA